MSLSGGGCIVSQTSTADAVARKVSNTITLLTSAKDEPIIQ